MGTSNDISIYRDYRELKEYIAEYSYIITSSEKLKYDPIFITRKNKVDLFDVFLINLPNDVRDFFNTKEFKEFFNIYAKLAYITNDGEIKSIIWNEENYQGRYRNAIRACRKMVEMSRICNAFEYDPRDAIMIDKDYIQIGSPSNNSFYIVLDLGNLNLVPKIKTHTEEWFRKITKI